MGRHTRVLTAVFSAALFLGGAVFAQSNLAREIKDMSTPDKLQTRLGVLNFNDGRPSEKTAEILYDNLNYLQGVNVFLNTLSGVSMYAAREGLRSVGGKDNSFVIFENFLDSETLVLTGNTESMYAIGFLNLKDGPIVLDCPPNVLGLRNDMRQFYLADVGLAGADKGKGGKYVILPPDFKGDIPKGYFVVHSPTYGVLVLVRGFVTNNDPAQAAKEMRENLKAYPLAQAKNPQKTEFTDATGKAFNMIFPGTFQFYEMLNKLVQEEPVNAFDPELAGQTAAIGIVKGKPFAPDAKMRKALEDAAATGSATARALAFRPHEAAYKYPNSAWYDLFLGGSHEFLNNGARNLDARTLWYFIALTISPAMNEKNIGVGSQYASIAKDSKGEWLDGAKTYKLHLPNNVPAKNFWSVTLYDPQTRSLLRTSQPQPSVSSQTGKVAPNADGSYDLYFGPKAPAGKEGNWAETVPGKGWFAFLRLYGPLEPWFDKTWKPGEIEKIK